MTPAGNSKHAVRFMVLVALVTVSLSLLTLVVASAQFGRFTLESFTICKAVEHRQAAAQRMPGRKLVLVGGSSVRLGVNGRLIADALRVPVLNFGLHAGLGPELVLDAAKDALRPGDTALLLFEYNQFVYDHLTTVAIDYILACEKEHFLESDLADQAAVLLGVTSKRILRTLRFQPPPGRCAWCADEQTAGTSAGPIAVGDTPLTAATFPPVAEERARRLTRRQPISIALDPTADGPKAIADFVRWAQANKIKVIASWPNTIDFAEYRTSAGMAAIAEFYRRLGVPVLGKPESALFPPSHFYDTQYHLNRHGIVQRTQQLIALLKQRMVSASAPRH